MKFTIKYYNESQKKMISINAKNALPVDIYPNFVMSIGKLTYRYESTLVDEKETIYYFARVNIDGYL